MQEETGIEATFERVVAFRHWHGAMFGKSDLFFVCLLRARSAPPHANDCSRWSLSRIPSALRCRGVSSSEPFRLQAAEIEKAKWGDFAEFLEQAPYPRDSPQWARIYGLCLPFTKAVAAAGDGARSRGFEAESLPNGMGRAGSCYIYHTVAEAEAFELHADARELDEEVIRSFKQLSES